MEIKTERLTLKPFRLRNLFSTYSYGGDKENTTMMMFLPYKSIFEAANKIIQSKKQWKLDKPDFLAFAIFYGRKHIGSITLYFTDDPHRAELGWLLHRDYHNRGYITECARAVIRYAKEFWGINCIFACCDSENVASYRVMEKLGMHRISCIFGRQNRSSEDKRYELTYEMQI